MPFGSRDIAVQIMSIREGCSELRSFACEVAQLLAEDAQIFAAHLDTCDDGLSPADAVRLFAYKLRTTASDLLPPSDLTTSTRVLMNIGDSGDAPAVRVWASEERH